MGAMRKPDIGYFCPFAKQICRQGIAARDIFCQFWDSDTSRCGLLWAISGLKNLDIIATALDSIAKKQGEV